MTRRIDVAPRADRQIDEALEWWAKNRTEAAELLAREIETAIDTLRQHPRVGEEVRSRRSLSIRRINLRRSGYFIYYSFSEEHIEVLALWHQSRGRFPKI